MISYAVMLADHIGIPQLRDMAGRSEQISTAVKLDDMPRLAGVFHPDVDIQQRKVEVNMRLSIGAQGFPEVAGRVEGVLVLNCQRCLGQLEWPIKLDFQLMVIQSEADFEEIPDRFDTVIADEHGIRLAEVVEDELLGSLPLAPMHDESVGCSAATLLDQSELNIEVDVDHGSEKPEDTHRPFEDLASLLSKDASSDGTD